MKHFNLLILLLSFSLFSQQDCPDNQLHTTLLYKNPQLLSSTEVILLESLNNRCKFKDHVLRASYRSNPNINYSLSSISSKNEATDVWSRDSVNLNSNKLINIAVSDLELHGLPKDISESLSNRLRTELFSTGKYTVIERSKMDEILKEQGFQQTGCTNSDCAVQVGQLLNVDQMVIGSVDLIGSVYSVQVRLVDVAKGSFLKVVAEDCNGCNLELVFTSILKKVARKLSGLSPLQETPLVVEKKEPAIPNGMVLIKTNTHSFYIDKFEVTQADYLTRMGKYNFKFRNCPTCPADNITFQNAKKYCEYLGKRLPSEVEWEVAARNYGRNTWEAIPKENKLNYGWFADNSEGRTHPVGQKQCNSFGVFDMLGNVWEWTGDMSTTTSRSFGFGYSSSEVPTAIKKGSGFGRWVNRVKVLDKEDSDELNDKSNDVGFRCIMDLKN